jgi:hypothetical protein
MFRVSADFTNPWYFTIFGCCGYWVSKQWYKRGFELRGKKTYIQVLEEIDLQL